MYFFQTINVFCNTTGMIIGYIYIYISKEYITYSICNSTACLIHLSETPQMQLRHRHLGLIDSCLWMPQTLMCANTAAVKGCNIPLTLGFTLSPSTKYDNLLSWINYTIVCSPSAFWNMKSRKLNQISIKVQQSMMGDVGCKDWG